MPKTSLILRFSKSQISRSQNFAKVIKKKLQILLNITSLAIKNNFSLIPLSHITSTYLYLLHIFKLINTLFVAMQKKETNESKTPNFIIRKIRRKTSTQGKHQIEFNSPHSETNSEKGQLSPSYNISHRVFSPEK